MAVGLSIALMTLFCTWFRCEFGIKAPFIFVSNRETNRFINSTSRGVGRSLSLTMDSPIVYTKLGPILGYKMKLEEGREIFAFTGVPYGEPPIGKLRFQNPVPKKPWRGQGVWKATLPSPYCIQSDASAGGGLSGEESCLFLDLFTPQIPYGGGSSKKFPVIIWIPGGANVNGKSSFYGPKYFLRGEDVILIVLNVRLGVFGWLSSGDEACPGNWALKDQALAIEFIYNNIEYFGGDPEKIVIGGISSGAHAALSMLFTKHKSKNYIKGVIALSGSSLGNVGLDAVGRVQESSDIIAKSLSCPSFTQGRSKEMVVCLRNLDAYTVAAFQFSPYITLPPLVYMLGPTLEPDMPGAFITELPEVLYEKGEVHPIPLIITRTEDENSLILQATGIIFQTIPIVSINWNKWMPAMFRKLGLRNDGGSKAPLTPEETNKAMMKVSQVYFNKTGPPNLFYRRQYRAFADVLNDNVYYAPAWRMIEKHHKVAPTFVYILKHNTFTIQPLLKILARVQPVRFGTPHAGDFLLLFNNSRNVPSLRSGRDFDKASRNLANLFTNFAAFGQPFYRTPKGELLPLWKPISDMNNPLVLEVGLVHNISMIRDPLVGSKRLELWNDLTF